MAYSRPVWNQLKGLTLKELARALKRDGWIEESRAGATIGFIKTAGKGAATRRRVVLHVHPGKSFGPVFCGRSLMTSAGLKTIWSD